MFDENSEGWHGSYHGHCASKNINEWTVCTENIEQDYGENCTTHGIPYILQRDQSLVHRVLWLIVLLFGLSFQRKIL